MKSRKFKKGKLVINVGQILEHDWFILCFGSGKTKTMHREVLSSWQLRTCEACVEHEQIYIAERLTNGEYYSGKTDEELREIAGENLCKSCLMTSSMRSTPLYAVKPIECLRGARVHCRDALAAWKEEPVE